MKTTLTVLLIINLCGLTSCATNQHYYVDQKMSWRDARQYCNTYYRSLSNFLNYIEEQQFLEYATIQTRTSDAWVGLRKLDFYGWMWTGFVPATNVSWDVGEPRQFCAILPKDSNKLSTQFCYSTLPFFCMTKSQNTVIVQQTESWEGALEYCRDHYDDLASLNSKNAMDYAVNKISDAQTQYVWIGLRFLAGEWFWINGDDLEYQTWSATGQPQCPAPNQRCAALDKKTNTWTNRDCEEKLNFLCFADNMPDIQ